MWGFEAQPDGFLSRGTLGEVITVMNMCRDVASLMGVNLAEAEPDTSDDDALFAALERELSVDDEAGETDPFSDDEANSFLFPDMSEDPKDALEMRTLMHHSLKVSKVDALRTMYEDLLDAVGFERDYPREEFEDINPFGEARIYVPRAHGAQWLAAMNSIRLTLAARLDISSEESAEVIYRHTAELQEEFEKSHEPSELSDTEMMAMMYTMLSWWQESLVAAVSLKLRRADRGDR